MRNIKSKKGEMSTQQIILLIVLIASFIVILFFLLRLNLGEESQEQLCRDSVLRKSSILSEAPLQCYRNYVCITEDGTCEGLIKPVKIKVKSLDEIYEALGEEMSNCWWMFGEGKIDYADNTALPENHCSICSQILFDDSLEKIEGIEEGEIKKDDLYNYLTRHNISSTQKITYTEYFLKTNDIEGLKKSISEDSGIEGKATFGMIDLKKQYFLVTGIQTDVSAAWIVGAIGAGVAGIFLPGVGWTITGVVFGALIYGAGEIAETIGPEIGAILVEGDGIENKFMAPTIQEVDSEKFKALNCEEILTYT